jgi:hypothetical protein
VTSSCASSRIGKFKPVYRSGWVGSLDVDFANHAVFGVRLAVLADDTAA